jgi:hypothetical protein
MMVVKSFFEPQFSVQVLVLGLTAKNYVQPGFISHREEDFVHRKK